MGQHHTIPSSSPIHLVQAPEEAEVHDIHTPLLFSPCDLVSICLILHSKLDLPLRFQKNVIILVHLLLDPTFFINLTCSSYVIRITAIGVPLHRVSYLRFSEREAFENILELNWCEYGGEDGLAADLIWADHEGWWCSGDAYDSAVVADGWEIRW